MAMPVLDSVVSYLRRVTPVAGSDDEQLLARFRAGDQLAFAALVHRYAGLVWGVCRRTLRQNADAEDAFQATFLILTRQARSLARGGPLGPWLHTVASRTAAKARARSLRRAGREIDAAGEPARYDPPPDDTRGLLDEEIGKLPDKYRLPVVLCYFEGLTNEQAAERLGCPKGTVLSRLSRAREQLRQRLARRGVELPAAVPALPAVSATLLETVTLAAPDRVISASVLSLAEGVTVSMSLHKLKLLALTMLALALAGGAGLWASRPAPTPAPSSAGPNKPVSQKAEKDEEKAKTPKADAKENRKPALTASNFQAALNREIEFAGFDDPSLRFGEALDQLAKVYDLQFDINEAAFAEDGMKEIREFEFNGIRPLKVSLRKVLEKLLSRLPAASGTTFVIRKDHIEITTENALRRELGLPARKQDENGRHAEPMTRLVWRDIRKEPLNTALGRIADDLDINIVLDARVDDKVKVEVTASLRNVTVETALKLLTHMAGLVFVRVENVYYVTTPEEAAKLKK